MKKPLIKITYRQLLDFCNANHGKQFKMDSDKECVLAQFAQKVLNIVPKNKKHFCEFTSFCETDERQIKFNGKQEYLFPQKFVDAVFDFAHDDTGTTFSGYYLALTIIKLAKRKF